MNLVYIYIYIYIQRERKREREREGGGERVEHRGRMHRWNQYCDVKTDRPPFKFSLGFFSFFSFLTCQSWF